MKIDLRKLARCSVPQFAFALIWATAQAAPITFNTALPVSDDEVLLRQQMILTQSSDRLSGAQRSMTQVTGVTVLGYGVTSKLAVFGALPVVYRDMDGVIADDEVFGLGDATLFARYQIFQRDGVGRTVRASAFAGATTPTGERNRTGDGSLDAFGGLVLTAATLNWVFDSQIKYVVNTEAGGFERGDAASLDASFQHRLFPNRITANTKGFVFAVLEANITHLDENRIAGMDDPNSGGVQMTISPGIQYAAKRWIAEAALGIPVVNELNGDALRPDYTVIASLRFNF